MTQLKAVYPIGGIQFSGAADPVFVSGARLQDVYHQTTSGELFTCVAVDGVGTPIGTYDGGGTPSCATMACPATNNVGDTSEPLWNPADEYTYVMGYYSSGTLVPDGWTAVNNCTSCPVDSNGQYFPILIRSPSTTPEPPFADGSGTQTWVGSQGTGTVAPTPAILATDHPDLIAMYTMDSISGLTLNDSSTTGNTNNATITGAVQADGVIGNCLTFNGINDQVEGTFGGTSDNDNTVSVWVKTTTTGNGIIYGQGTSFDSGTFRLIYFSGGDLLLVERIAGASGVSTALYSGFNDGNWHHIVGYFGPTYAELYVDGVLKEQIAKASTYTLFTTYVALGAVDSVGAVGTFDLDGEIDQFRYFGRELTPQEITDLYNEGISEIVAFDNPSLVAAYTMNTTDISGNTVTDASGNGKDMAFAALPSSTAGILGEALQFTGIDNHVGTVSGTLSNWTVGQYSFSGWLYYSGSSRDEIAFGTNDPLWGSSNKKLIMWIDPADSNRARVRCGELSLGGADVTSTTTYSVGWHHFTINMDISLGSVDLWVDGVFEGTNANPTYFNSSGTDLSRYMKLIDGNLYSSTNDQIRLFSRILSPAEIAELYNGGLGA